MSYCLICTDDRPLYGCKEDWKEMKMLLKEKERPVILRWVTEMSSSQRIQLILILVDDDEAFKIKMKFDNWSQFLFKHNHQNGDWRVFITPEFVDDGIVINGVKYHA